MLYPCSSPLSLFLFFSVPTTSIHPHAVPLLLLPYLSLTPVSSHMFLSLAFMFATIPQSIPLTLVFFNSLLSLLLSLRLCLSLLFQTFSQKIKGLRIFSVRWVNKAHEQTRSAETYIESNEQKVLQRGELTRSNKVKVVSYNKEESEMKQKKCAYSCVNRRSCWGQTKYII